MRRDEYLKKLEKECKIEFFISPGPGGQRKNRKKTAVKLIHLPTGIIITASQSRYQAYNRKEALLKLKAKLEKLKIRRKARIKTTPPAHAIAQRLRFKKIRSEKKKFRRKVDLSNEL